MKAHLNYIFTYCLLLLCQNLSAQNTNIVIKGKDIIKNDISVNDIDYTICKAKIPVLDTGFWEFRIYTNDPFEKEYIYIGGEIKTAEIKSFIKGKLRVLTEGEGIPYISKNEPQKSYKKAELHIANYSKFKYIYAGHIMPENTSKTTNDEYRNTIDSIIIIKKASANDIVINGDFEILQAPTIVNDGMLSSYAVNTKKAEQIICDIYGTPDLQYPLARLYDQWICYPSIQDNNYEPYSGNFCTGFILEGIGSSSFEYVGLKTNTVLDTAKVYNLSFYYKIEDYEGRPLPKRTFQVLFSDTILCRSYQQEQFIISNSDDMYSFVSGNSTNWVKMSQKIKLKSPCNNIYFGKFISNEVEIIGDESCIYYMYIDNVSLTKVND